MYITGEAVCKKCGQVVKVDSENFYSCDENHFSIKLGSSSNTYKTDEGRGYCVEIINEKRFYTQEDFTELNEECYNLISQIKEAGVSVRLYKTKSADDKKFVSTISSDMFKSNEDNEYTELDLTIYLDKRYRKTVEDVAERLKKYYEMVKLIMIDKVDLNDRNKIEELNLFLDAEEEQKKLYDVKYYF